MAGYFFLRPASTAGTLDKMAAGGARKYGRVSDVIKEDHRELKEYYNQIINSSDHDVQTRYQNLFVWELARHAVAEEIVVYPVMEKSMPNGKAVAQKDREEHVKVKEQLHKFQGLKAADPEFLPVLKHLFGDLEQHIKEEEEDDLPKLEEAITAGDSASLAEEFERTKKLVPTRSHPSAPDKPPFETVVALMSAPIDKVMDIFRKFPKD